MLEWLEKDLAEANNNRDNQPWIIGYAHQPLYCSRKDQSCLYNAQKFAEFEALLVKYKVDLMVGAHVHFYERMLPIKNGAVGVFKMNEGDVNFTEIINPEAPVYILQGIAGHKGETNSNQDIYKGKSFSVKVSKNFSFLAVSSKNNTHLLMENVRSDDGTVDDYFYIVRKELQEEELNNVTKPINETETQPVNVTEPSHVIEPVNVTKPSNETEPMNETKPGYETKPDNTTEPSIEIEPSNTTESSNDDAKQSNSATGKNGYLIVILICLFISILV